MKTATTKWLLLTALGLLGFILLFERDTLDTPDILLAQRRILPGFNPSRARSVEIRLGTNTLLRVEKTDPGVWACRYPVSYPARTEPIERFLKTLRELSFQGAIHPGELKSGATNGLAAFGLQPPAAVVTVETDSGREELRLGKRTVLGRQIYLQRAGADRIYLTADSLLKELPQSPAAWRDPALLPAAPLRIRRIEARPQTNGFEVARDPQTRRWEMLKPLRLAAHTAKIDYLLQQLRLSSIAQFVDDAPEPRLARYGLAPPRRELLLYGENGEPQTLQIGAAATNRTDLLYVRNLSLGPVGLAPRAALEPWLGSYRDFCDRRMMVFDPEKVRRIRIKGKETFDVVRETNGTWRILPPFSAPADPALVMETLSELAQAEFIEFEREVAADFKPYGLDPPLREYALYETAQTAAKSPPKPLARMALGKPKRLLLFARRDSENSVLLIPDNPRLPLAAYQLRDRQIWNVSTNQIAAITVTQAGKSFRLVRQGPFNWVLASGQAQFHPLTIEETAYRVGRLRAARWVDRGKERLARYGFDRADYRLLLEVKGQTGARELRLGARSPGGGRYGATDLGPPFGWVIFEVPEPILAFLESDLTVQPLP
ncbi:MAG: DUF4340 domain-containing protein [Verrucomicrobia bacterium]|nr:DUF4340 domain-containing protein [Verrucomicrobiota bacterium]